MIAKHVKSFLPLGKFSRGLRLFSDRLKYGLGGVDGLQEELQKTSAELAALRAELNALRARVDSPSSSCTIDVDTLDALLMARCALAERSDWTRNVSTEAARKAGDGLSLDAAFRELERLAPKAFGLWREAVDVNGEAYEGFPLHSCSVPGHKMADRFRFFLRPYLRGNVLDIGCGPQPIPFYLSGYPVERIYGVDPLSEPAHHPFEFVPGLAEFLPWQNGQFDVVVAATSLDHVLLLDRALEEVARVLKPGGHFVLWVAFVPGAKAYDPHADDVAMLDEFHLFHFDKPWFTEKIDGRFHRTEFLEVVDGCHQCFCSLVPRRRASMGPGISYLEHKT